MTGFPLNVIGWGLCPPSLPFSSQQLYSYHWAIICFGWPIDCRYKLRAPQIVTSLSCFTVALMLATMKGALWRSVFQIKCLIKDKTRKDGSSTLRHWDFYICYSPSIQVSVFKSTGLTLIELIVETDSPGRPKLLLFISHIKIESSHAQQDELPTLPCLLSIRKTSEVGFVPTPL